MKIDDVDIMTMSFFFALLFYPILLLLTQIFNVSVIVFPITMLIHNLLFWGSLISVNRRVG